LTLGEKKEGKRQDKDFYRAQASFFVKVHKIYDAKNNNDKDEEEELIEAHITSDFLLFQVVSKVFSEHFRRKI
jgi:hypothetical protein